MSTSIRSIQTILDAAGPLRLPSSDAYLSALRWDRHVRSHNPHPLPGEFCCFVQFQHAGRHLVRIHQTICSYWGDRYIRRHEATLTLSAKDLVSVEARSRGRPEIKWRGHSNSLDLMVNTIELEFAQLTTVKRYMCVPFYHTEVESEVDTIYFSIPLLAQATTSVLRLLKDWQSSSDAEPGQADSFPVALDPGSVQ